MNKEFCTYEQALALKELGFDEPCLADFLKEEFGFKNINNRTFGEKLSDIVNAPLYQQAFRWFREKYDIQGYIYSSTVRGNEENLFKRFTGYIWNIRSIDMPFLSTDARDELHDTYEEAEQACLDKLIEIVRLTKP